METKTRANLWWLKSTHTEENLVPKLDLNPSTTLVDLLEKDNNSNCDVDVGSIIEEINKVAAQSPLGPFEKNVEERSIDDLMKEAEKIFLESSKSFEQLSQRSKTSQNISDLLSELSNDSTPTPKSISPLPMDLNLQDSSESGDDYTEDFVEEVQVDTNPSSRQKSNDEKILESVSKEHTVKSQEKPLDDFIEPESSSVQKDSSKDMTRLGSMQYLKGSQPVGKSVENEDENKNAEYITNSRDRFNVGIEQYGVEKNDNFKFEKELLLKDDLIQTLEEDNRNLKFEIQEIKLALHKTNGLLEKSQAALSTKSVSSPELNIELEKALEHLKDSKEINTALQLQLDAVNKSHQLLKSSYDDLANSNQTLERRLVELDSTLDKYKSEILSLQKSKDKLLENEINLNKLVEIEKLQSKSLKLQNEKDARCILDLNRQIKEMERIIARKHPDSVSALIVAAKENATDTNLTARKILEDRIKALEQEQLNRESQSSKVFMEIQEKFNQMKAKYENHIEDLETHVEDLKNQLKNKCDSYEVYTQTVPEKVPAEKATVSVHTQTDAPAKPQKQILPRKNPSEVTKEDAHLLATIRGLQADLTNKEKVLSKLQKEVDDLKKTNRRLQKEREGSLKSLIDKKEFRSYPERLSSQTRSNSASSEREFRKEEQLNQMKCERDKLKEQLSSLEADYQALKTKRIQDLTALQEAHEREVANYVASVTPLREQLELQQVSIAALQSQVSAAKEELAVVTIERDHLNNRLLNVPYSAFEMSNENTEVSSLLKKIAFLEKRYEEREYRLRAIVQSLAQKSVTNRSCEQCAERQQQLIAYKVELDQLLATVRALH
nr:centrosomal protein of 162 kDa isoform X1 [Leptinotarsa decemlineata]XP_023027663.1 centrosomal protein of 162 kDa isoform X2 [Leptinotarsa decemlineata]